MASLICDRCGKRWKLCMGTCHMSTTQKTDVRGHFHFDEVCNSLEGEFYEVILVFTDGSVMKLNSQATKNIRKYESLLYNLVEIVGIWQYPEEQEEIRFYVEDGKLYKKRPCEHPKELT